MKQKSLLTTKQVAEIFQVESKTVLLWVSTLKISAIQIGKGYRFEQSAVDALIEKLRVVK